MKREMNIEERIKNIFGLTKELADVFKKLKGDSYSLSDTDEMKKFIDSVFLNSGNLKLAWETPAFPFSALNEAWKSLTGSDYPVFKDLFDYSFTREAIAGEPKTAVRCGYFTMAQARQIIFGNGGPITA